MNKRAYIKTNVGGPLLEKTVSTLAKIAKQIPEYATIVDIGTCEGKSAFILALYSHPSVKIVTIDPTPNPRFEYHREALDFEDRITLFKKKSQDVDLIYPIWMFFNDGLHGYADVLRDNAKFCPLVVRGGLCVFDDFRIYVNDVRRAVKEDEGKYYKRLKVVDNVYIGERI